MVAQVGGVEGARRRPHGGARAAGDQPDRRRLRSAASPRPAPLPRRRCAPSCRFRRVHEAPRRPLPVRTRRRCRFLRAPSRPAPRPGRSAAVAHGPTSTRIAALRRPRGELHAFVFERRRRRRAGGTAALAFDDDHRLVPFPAGRERRRPGADHGGHVLGRRPVVDVPPDPLAAFERDLGGADRRLDPVRRRRTSRRDGRRVRFLRHRRSTSRSRRRSASRRRFRLRGSASPCRIRSLRLTIRRSSPRRIRGSR